MSLMKDETVIIFATISAGVLGFMLGWGLNKLQMEHEVYLADNRAIFWSDYWQDLYKDCESEFWDRPEKIERACRMAEWKKKVQKMNGSKK